MGKTLGYGEITVANMTEPFTVMLTNEAQQFATDSNRKVTSAQSYYTDIIVIRGSQERTDYTIGNITSGSGITVSKNSKRVTFSVSAGTTIGADTGVIEIPITLDGQTVKKQFSWSCGKQGPQGVKGENGSNFAWNLVKGTGTPKEFKPQTNLNNSSTVFYMLDLSDNLPSLGDKFTISCDIEWTQFTQGTGGTFSWWFQGSVDGGWIYDNLFTTALRGVQPSKDTLLSSSGSKHLSASCTIGAALVGKKVFEIGARFNYSDGTGMIKVSNLKIAKEDKESPWCLHPDELKGDKGKSVQSVIEYYLATSASSNVTSSTNGWSTDPTMQKLTAEKKYLWNCKQTVYDDGTRGSITSPVICGTYGDKGQKGDNAKNLSITPSSQYFKSTDGGKTFAPNTITIKPTIQGEINFGKWQYSIDGGVSFADVVSGQKGLTISNNVLTVSKDSSLYSDAVTMVTFRAVASDSSFYDTCSIAKIYDVSDIGDGRNLLWNSNFAKTDETINTSTYTTWGLILRGSTYTATIDTSVKHNNFNTLKVIGTKDGENGGQDLIYRIKGLNLDEVKFTETDVKYTLSFYSKASTACNFSARYAYDSYAKDTNVALSTDWKRYEIQMHPTTTSYQTALIFKMDAASTVWFSEFKLEKGSSATGYSTAPEDVQTAILSTKSEISDVSLKVDKNKQAIEQRVEKTTYQQDLKLVKGDISKANEGLNKWRYEIYPKSLFASEYQSKYTMDVFAKNKNLTPSQSVLLDDASLSTGMDYGDSYIAYGLTFIKMSAAKSVTTTLHNDDGASFYVNGKQIISNRGSYTAGVSITFNLTKGWNCLEIVLNEIDGREGFKFAQTLSKLSECQLMNCYYGTPVARQSHITNQLVQNTTDIKGISTKVSKVTSVIGDNGENFTSFKNDYSDFKQTMNGFKTTVGQTYVTKDDFNGLEIGGRNLARKGCIALWDTSATFNDDTFSEDGSVTFSRKSATANSGVIIDRYVTYEQGQQYVISFKMKANSGTVNSFYLWNGKGHTNNSVYVDGIKSGTLHADVSFPTDGQYHQITAYFTATGTTSTEASDIDINQHLILQPIKGTAVTYTVQLLNFKIEKGNKATDYTPAPEDNEINGQNLVSNLPSNWEQGSINYTANLAYGSLKSTLVSRLRTKDVFPVSGNITISAGTSTNSSKEELNFYYVLFDINKKSISHGDTWQSLTSPKIINCGNAKYMAIILRWGSGSTAITPSDISQICLKIERGTSATPFTLAPEDVNGKIVNVETIANQTAKEFSWIVKGGDSSSNFTLTDRVADLVAERINFKGLVTFSGATNLIENSNMMNGLANITSECKAIKVIDDSTYRKALVITPIAGGRIFWGVANVWKANITYTVSFVAKSSVAGQKIKPSRSVADWGDEITLTTSYVKYTTRIKSTATADGGTLSFSFSNAIGDVTLTNVKLETGMNPTDWSPAPGDYITQASLVRNWTTNTTWINGGKIYTGSITADKIAANTITADKIATDAIKSRNYISSGCTQGSFLNLSDGSFQSPNLSWDSNGNLIAKNANLSGQITATNGSIGKYKITGQWLITGSGSTATGIGGNQAFWAGAEDSNSAPFRVGYDGKLYANGATISGDITATTGKIGDLTLKDGILTGTGSYSEPYTEDDDGTVTSTITTNYITKLFGKGLTIDSTVKYSDEDDVYSYKVSVLPDEISFTDGEEIGMLGAGGLRILQVNDNSDSYSSEANEVSLSSGASNFYYTTPVNQTTDKYLHVCFSADGASFMASQGDKFNSFDIGYSSAKYSGNFAANKFVYTGNSLNYVECLEANDTTNVYFHSNGYYSFRVNNEGNWSNETQSVYITGHGVSVPGQIGLYSQEMSNYVARYYIAGSTKSTAIGNNSYQTRIYGSSVWANKAVSTSDVRLKQDFQSLDKFEDLYMQLQPVSFKYIDGYDKSEDRYFGLKAQPTEKLFEDMGENPDDYAMFNKFGIDHEDIKERIGYDVDFDEEHGLDYTNLITLNTHMVQKTRRELAELQKENAELKDMLKTIVKKINM